MKDGAKTSASSASSNGRCPENACKSVTEDYDNSSKQVRFFSTKRRFDGKNPCVPNVVVSSSRCCRRVIVCAANGLHQRESDGDRRLRPSWCNGRSELQCLAAAARLDDRRERRISTAGTRARSVLGDVHACRHADRHAKSGSTPQSGNATRREARRGRRFGEHHCHC